VENAVWNSPPRDMLEDEKEVVAVTLFDLLRAFHEVVKRFESQTTMELDQEEITIDQKLTELRRMLIVHDSLVFSSFFAKVKSKRHLIVTFLALLELVRLREIWLYQEKAFEEIHITRSKSAGETA
jgi:segregation and condensation protein A